jgi:hypothetical protein
MIKEGDVYKHRRVGDYWEAVMKDGKLRWFNKEKGYAPPMEIDYDHTTWGIKVRKFNDYTKLL